MGQQYSGTGTGVPEAPPAPDPPSAAGPPAGRRPSVSTRHRTRLTAILVGCGVAAVLIIGLTVFRPYLPISCTVGASGTALNVTADGWGAGKACDAMLGSSINVNGFSPYSTNPFGNVVCVVPLGSVTYTVRDTGLLDIFGNAVCQYLQSQTPAAQAAASEAASASAVAASASASAEAQQQLQQEQDAISQTASTVLNDINALATAGDTINASMKDADKVLATAQADLDKAHQGLVSGQTCYDASTVSYDASVVQYDQSSMQYVQSTEQYATGSVKGQISTLDSDWSGLQTAESALPSYSADAPTAAQVESAEQGANGAISQGDKTMAGYLAKVQDMVDKANRYATAASKQFC